MFPLLSCTHLVVVIIWFQITYRIRPSLALVVDLILLLQSLSTLGCKNHSRKALLYGFGDGWLELNLVSFSIKKNGNGMTKSIELHANYKLILDMCYKLVLSSIEVFRSKLYFDILRIGNTNKYKFLLSMNTQFALGFRHILIEIDDRTTLVINWILCPHFLLYSLNLCVQVALIVDQKYPT